MTTNHTDSRGFSLLTASIMVAVIMAFGIVLVSYVLSSREASKSLEAAVSGTQIAEAGIRKAIFCLNATNGTKCGGSYGTGYMGETGVSFGGGSFTTTVSSGGSARTITSTGTTPKGSSVKIIVDVTTVPPTDETAFSYALQSGDGGAHLENGATISGTLYANGDVDCQTPQAVIDGDVYVAKTNGMVNACGVNYHAHADRVLNSEVDGDAYFRNDPADIAGSTIAGAKYPGSTTPEVEDLPSLDLEFWRQSAAAGGTIYGNHSPADNTHLGPVKIVGDLTLANNVDVIIDGPVWVVGNITMNNGSTFTLDPSFGAFSTTILADDPDHLATKGFINVVNGSQIFGSGNIKSHIMLATTNTSTSDTVPALSVANTASGAIFFALNGTMRLQSNGGAKSLAAKRLFIDQNAVITYVESELSDMNFSNSPGGTWTIQEGTWRETR